MLNDLEYYILVYVCLALRRQLTSLQGMSQLMSPQDMEGLILTCIGSMEKVEPASRCCMCGLHNAAMTSLQCRLWGLSKEVY